MQRACLAMTLSLCAGFAAAAPVNAPPILSEVVIGLADYKTFKATDAQLDAVFSPHCRKLRSIKDAQGVFYEYSCAAESGLKTASVTVTRSAKGVPFLLGLQVVFSNDYYADIRKKVSAKLGKTKLANADQAIWEYTRDKQLNENGNPVIMMSRDRDEKLTSFDVALEQGP